MEEKSNYTKYGRKIKLYQHIITINNNLTKIVDDSLSIVSFQFFLRVFLFILTYNIIKINKIII